MNRFGFLKVAAAVPHVRIADCDYNAQHITELIRKGADRGASIILFPELCITSYTCGDLIQQPALLHAAEQALGYILAQTRELPIVAIVGMPVTYGNALYNCAVVFAQGRIHGVVPKTYIPNYSEFYEARCFMSGEEIGLATIRMCGQDTDFGRNMLFNIGGVKFGVEICEDMWVPAAPSLHQAVDGAQILFNLSASPEVLGKHNYLLTLVKSQSARTQSAYIYCSAGYGESSTDLVFGGNGLIVESGRMLRRTERFSTEEQLIVADIDTEKLLNSRRRTTTFAPHRPAERIIVEIPLPENPANVTLDREFSSHPFVPQTPEEMDESGREIINIQTMGLAQRLQHTDCKKVVIGVSGGLDSTLALLIAVRTFDRLGLDRKGIIGVTMPGFGTSNRTYRNSIALMRCLGITSREISIRKACEHGQVNEAVIVGGGFIGLEAAVALSDMWGVKVSVVEMMDQMLPGVLSHNMGKMAAHDCEAHGLSVYTSEKVVKLEGKDGAVCKVITDKRELPAQLVIFAAGFLPNGQLAKDAGLEVAPFGAVVVNEKMQTSDPDIYAGGDCVAIKNLITGKLGYLPLGSMANRQGRVIGTNLAGGDASFPGFVGTWAVKLFDMSFCGAGLTVERARKEGYDAISVAVEQLDRAHFYPEKNMMSLELVVDKSDRRVLGIQGACTAGDALKARIDAVAAVLQYGKPTVEDISNLEISYAPPFASAMDVVNVVANVADNVLAGRVKPITSEEFMALWEKRAENNIFFIDARPAKAGQAVQAVHPEWHSISLEEMPSRVNEVPKDRPVAIICNTGLRAYDSVLILARNGITDVVNAAGGMQAVLKTGGKI